MSDLKILLFDIECSMAQGYFYGLYDQNISIENIIEHPRMIAFSAKWYGKKGTMFFSEYHDGRREMFDKMHALLEEADVVVGFNSKRFDVKWVNSEFMVEGYTPPAPYKQIDIMQEIKRNARFISNKLDYLSGRLLNDGKHEYSMARMWRIVNNSATDEGVRKREWDKMKRYAVKDTNLLDPMLTILLPWVKMPHPVSESTEEALCHSCGSSEIARRGYTLTLTGKYQRYRCDSCGAWHRGTTRVASSPIRAI